MVFDATPAFQSFDLNTPAASSNEMKTIHEEAEVQYMSESIVTLLKTRNAKIVIQIKFNQIHWNDSINSIVKLNSELNRILRDQVVYKFTLVSSVVNERGAFSKISVEINDIFKAYNVMRRIAETKLVDGGIINFEWPPQIFIGTFFNVFD